MEFNVFDISSSEKEIEIKLNYNEIKEELEKEIQKGSKKIQIPGFRKGKVPVNMVKKIYGDALDYEASEKVANNWFWKATQENNLKPIGQPSMIDLQFEPGKDLTFKVKYEVIPLIELKDYKDLKFEIPEFIAKEEEVDREIDYILESKSSTEVTDVVGNDDNFIIDVEAVRIDKKGEPYEGAHPEKFHLHLYDDKVQPEIKDNSRGKKVDDTFEFSFNNETEKTNDSGEKEKITEEFSYKFKILEIKKRVLPELNEEFIKNITKDKSSNETELRDSIKKNIQNYYDERTDEFIRGKLISEIVKNNDFVPPSSLVANVLKEYVKSEEEQAKKNKIKSFNKEETKQRLQKPAENEVKWYLIKNEIIKKENIEIGESELLELAQRDSEKTGIAVDKLLNFYKSSNQSERLLDKKLFDFLKLHSNISKVDPEKFNKKAEAKNE